MAGPDGPAGPGVVIAVNPRHVLLRVQRRRFPDNLRVACVRSTSTVARRTSKSVSMLSELRRTAEHPRLWGAAALALTVVVLLSYYAVRFGLNTAPSTSGDELSYDTIGWNLAHGNGFAEGGRDPEFFRVYGESAAESLPAEPDLVAHRPPLFPWLLSVLNRILGRQFWSVRLLNVLATAGTAALLVWYLAKTQSKVAALAGVVLFLLLDTRTRLYGRAILTEATSTFLFTVLTVLLLQLKAEGRRWPVVLSGLVAGLLVLDRTVFGLWLPWLAVVVAVACRRVPENVPESSTDRSWRSSILSGGLFLLMAAVVLLPWGLRNVRVLNAMMPLGTQGMSQLPAGFSDHALERQGVWDMQPTIRLRRQVEAAGATRLERDVARARLGQQEAFAWIRTHPGGAVHLGGLKIWQEYRPRTPTEWLLCLLAVCGCLVSWRHPDTRLFLMLHAISCLVIACTWSVEGRFVMPLMFTTHVWAARMITLPFGRNDTEAVAS